MAIKIYTAGAMCGLTYHQQMDWRYEIEKMIENKTEQLINFIHPPLYYDYSEPSHKTEKEVMDWDLCHLKECDIAAVNLDNITSSIGTLYELATINAVNRFENKHIYAIGFNCSEEEYKKLHPWIKMSLHRYEETMEAAASYIADYLII